MTRFTGWLVFLVLVCFHSALPAWASPVAGCSRNLVKPETEQKSDFAPWTILDPKLGVGLTPDSFLPASFVRELRDQGWTLGLDIKKTIPDGTTFLIYAENEPHRTEIVIFELKPTSVSGKIKMDGLTLENPLAGSYDSLHPNQSNKGLPMQVFLFARDRLYSFLRAGGYHTLVSGWPQNFLVSNLYGRMLRGTRTPAGESFHSTMKESYRIASTEFPESRRVKSLDQFAEILGDAFGLRRGPGRVTIEAAKFKVLTTALREKWQNKGISPLFGSDPNVPIALADKKGLLFLVPMKVGFEPCVWSDVIRNHSDWVEVTVDLKAAN